MEKNIQQTIQDVRNCQTNLGYNSCMSCIAIVKCETRNNYVKSAYKSMNPKMGEENIGFAF
jgi:hypothetical protein